MKKELKLYFLLLLLISSPPHTNHKRHSFRLKHWRRSNLRLSARTMCVALGKGCGGGEQCCAGTMCDNLKINASGNCERCVKSGVDCNNGTDTCCPDELCLPCPKRPQKYRCQRCLDIGEVCTNSNPSKKCCYACQNGRCAKPSPKPNCLSTHESCKTSSGPECCTPNKCQYSDGRFQCTPQKTCSEYNDDCSRINCCSGMDCLQGICKTKPTCKGLNEVCNNSFGPYCCGDFVCDGVCKAKKACADTDRPCSPSGGMPCCSLNDECYQGTCRGKPGCALDYNSCGPIKCCNSDFECINGMCLPTVRCGSNGQPCSNKKKCCDGFECNNSYCSPIRKCKMPPETCLTKVDCCPEFTCVLSKCTACTSFNNECSLDTDCCSPYKCESDQYGSSKKCLSKSVDCIQATGHCGHGTPCCKGLSCKAGLCVACKKDFKTCVSSEECCDGFVCEEDSGMKFCKPGNRCANKSQECSTSSDCCEGLKCRENGICDDCVDQEKDCSDFECCDSMACTRNALGEGSFCFSNPPCIIDNGKCINNSECCDKSARCISHKCTICNDEGMGCKNDTNCCRGLSCYFSSSGRTKVCLAEQPCIKETGDCLPGVRDCCDNDGLTCENGFCIACIPPNHECKPGENCCEGKFCLWESSGQTKTCQAKGGSCIAVNGRCDQPGQKCCSSFTCVGSLCQDCKPEGTACVKGGDRCCGSLGCHLDRGRGETICRKAPDCSPVEGNCSDVSDCCDSKLLCLSGRCLPCLKIDIPCQIDSECCSSQCYYNGKGDRVCWADMNCKKEGDSCQIDGDVPSCCSGFKCLGKKCRKCSGDGKVCKSQDDCCSPSMSCNWNKGGTDTICTTNTCIDLGGSCENTGMSIAKKCCQGDCYDSKTCSICKEYNEECNSDSSCCPGFKCFYSSNGSKKCLASEQCVNIAPLTCNLEPNHRPFCCKEFRCIGTTCVQCLANGETCDDPKKCCSSYCGNDSMGKGKICKDFTPNDCISKNGVCDIEKHLNCCEGTSLSCYKGICVDYCEQDGNRCTDMYQCCSKNCVFNAFGEQICGINSVCVSKIGGKCNTKNGQPECCKSDGLYCIGRACKKCKARDEVCTESTDCCEDSCFWNSIGNEKQCNNRICMELNEPCDAFQITEPHRKCCHGVCYQQKCQDCILDNEFCTPGLTNCCSKICDFDSQGIRRCLSKPATCVSQIKGICESDGDQPKCCKDQGLTCFNGHCELCTADELPCEDSETCCNRNCYWDKSGRRKVCRPGEHCIEKKGECNIDVPEKLCCGTSVCYQSRCVDMCVDDGKPCNSINPCCSGSCVHNGRGEEICGRDSVCVDQGFPCDDFSVTSSKARKCCPLYQCVNRLCKICASEGARCDDSFDCCSGNCNWDEFGLRMKCYPKDVNPCIRLEENCLNDPNKQKKLCCNKGQCYEGRCKGDCLLDHSPCEKDNECCSDVCAFDPITTTKKCLKSRECVNKGACEIDNGEPKCCNGVSCFQNVCSNCLKVSRPCQKDEDCCDGNCYWNETGLLLICRKDKEKCIPINGFCGKGKFDPLSVEKVCCHDLKCFQDKCKKCELGDGEECQADQNCCSGKCVILPSGKPVCGQKDSCIEMEGADCDPTGNSPKVCCEARNFFCIDSMCKSCYPKSRTCSYNIECCSGICGWDSTGKVTVCQDKDFCINPEGSCDLNIPLNKNVFPRNCCKGTCYRGKCMKCLGNESPCLEDTNCCSGVCMVSEAGLRICRETRECSRENGNCQVVSGEPKCCIGLTCNDGICSRCKSEGETCSNHLECCTLHCHFEIKFNIFRCKRLPSIIDTKCAKAGKRCLSHENCCEGLICQNTKCSGDCGKKGETCSSSMCCVGLDCVDNKCIEMCSKSAEKCDDDNPCCYGLICSPDNTCYDPYSCTEKDLPCSKDYDCCSGMECSSENLCKPENPECKTEGIGCTIHIECCEGYCFQGKCTTMVFPSCSHYKESCRNSKDCCFGLICENGACSLEEDKTRRCSKLGMPCDADNYCCKGYDCVSNKCLKLPACKKEGDLCNVGECCGFLGCYYDEFGVDLKCYKTQRCIKGNGFCDRKERLCCEGFCYKPTNQCRQKCIPKDGECCEDSECCDDMTCFNKKCKKKICYLMGQICNEPDKPCCTNFECDKKTNTCKKTMCELKRDKEFVKTEKIVDQVQENISKGFSNTLLNKLRENEKAKFPVIARRRGGASQDLIKESSANAIELMLQKQREEFEGKGLNPSGGVISTKSNPIRKGMTISPKEFENFEDRRFKEGIRRRVFRFIDHKMKKSKTRNK